MGHLLHSEGHRGKLEFLSAGLFTQADLAIGWFLFPLIEILARLLRHFYGGLKVEVKRKI